MRFTRSRKPSSSITSSVALPAAIASGLPPKVEPCVPGVMPLPASLVDEEGADRESAAERLGERHDVGLDAGTLIGEQLAGAAHAALHLVEDQQQAVLVAQRAQAAQEMVLRHAHATLALDRLDQDRGGLRADRLLHRLEIAERHLVEAFDHRAEAFEIFLLSARRERRERAAVERALEGDDAIALGLAVDRVELARGLDRAFHRLGAGIAEEDVVRKACGAQPVAELLLLGNAEQIGDVDRLVRLRRRWPARLCGCAWPSAFTATPEVKSR